jgi:hypothetical protein
VDGQCQNSILLPIPSAGDNKEIILHVLYTAQKKDFKIDYLIYKRAMMALKSLTCI